MSDKEQKNNNYKITNQSGLYHRDDITKIVDDEISDRRYTKSVKLILSCCLAVQILGGLFYKVLNPISLSLFILALILFIIASVTNARLYVLLMFHNEKAEAFESALKHRKIFVILRDSTFWILLASLVMYIFGY